jgi:hypothetical protein
MTKKLLRYAGPIALAIGLTGGVLGAGTAGASTNGKTHHPHHHQAPKPKNHPKKKSS